MVLAAFALAAVVAGAHSSGGLAAASPSAWVDETAQADAPPTRFKCQTGADLSARFDARGPKLLMIVDAGDGPHALPITPWDGGPVRLTWSDGQRTLVWSPGVQIMWMDGAEHRMCGGGMHHEH
ncbi:MAG: hypothetical protein ACXWKO_08000 [Phenylobacterium sp.]